MDLLSIVLQGIVEGLTEFLPVSSTGHIILIQKLTGFSFEQKELVTVLLQFSAILAAIIFFKKTILNILSNSLQSIKTGAIKTDLGFWITISIIPVLLIGFLLRDQISLVQESPLIIGIASILFGVVFYLIERLNYTSAYSNKITLLGFKNILMIVLSQIIAFIPGVSRSGIIIATGLSQKQNFKKSIEFAFISGIPVILIASIYEVLRYVGQIRQENLFVIFIGCIVSFVTAFFSIKLTIGFLEKKGFFRFMIYRVVFGLILLTLFL